MTTLPTDDNLSSWQTLNTIPKVVKWRLFRLLNSVTGGRPHKVHIDFENDLRKEVVILLS